MGPSPIIEKIRKLHALAERAGTEHEAACAAGFMEELCRKHNLDPAVLFGDRWQSSRTRRIVTEMRIETERKVYESKTWVQEIEHIFGPCLACAVEIKYATRGSYWGKEWIKEQFEPHTRRKLVHWLETGAVSRQPSFSALQNLLCKPCVQKFGAIRDERLKDLEFKRESREERRAEQCQEEMRQEAWKREWRQPQPAEFKRTEGAKAFVARMGNHEHEILFRWRISNRCKCRGNHAGAVVGMWVDRSLVSHYYGWDLTSDEKASYGGEYQDRFGTGFEVWFERRFQPLLLNARPDLRWSVVDRKLMGDVDEPEGWIVHVIWHDGQKYAKVGPLPTVLEAVKFAGKHLGMRITRSEYRPVLLKRTAAHR